MSKMHFGSRKVGVHVTQAASLWRKTDINNLRGEKAVLLHSALLLLAPESGRTTWCWEHMAGEVLNRY